MKRLLLSTVSLLTMTAAMAQKNAPGLYIRAGAGYTFALAGQTLDNNGLPYSGSVTYLPNNPTIITAFDAAKVSFASGAQAQVCAGYMFTRNLGVELDFTVIPTSIQYDTRLYNIINPYLVPPGGDIVTGYATRQLSFPLFITPSLVFSTNDDKMFSVYARGGVVMPIVSKIREDKQYTDNMTGEVEEVKQETKMKFGIGFSGSMGLKFNPSPIFSIWAELNMQALSLYVDQTTITDHTLNGDPPPANREPIVGTVIKYKTTGTYSAVLQPAYSIPFSNMGASIGIMVKLKAPKPVEEEPHKKK